MSKEYPSAPPSNNQNIGFSEDLQNNPNNLPYPPSYATANSFPPYPVNNASYPANYPQYPQPNHPYPPQNGSTPYAPHAAYPPMNQNVYTSQPTAATNTIIIQELKLSSEPITTQCPNCKETVTTNVKYKSGKRTHGAALLLCAFDADCCALLPYCCDAAKDAHHSCPKCKHYFGKHEPTL